MDEIEKAKAFEIGYSRQRWLKERVTIWNLFNIGGFGMWGYSLAAADLGFFFGGTAIIIVGYIYLHLAIRHVTVPKEDEVKNTLNAAFTQWKQNH